MNISCFSNDYDGEEDGDGFRRELSLKELMRDKNLSIVEIAKWFEYTSGLGVFPSEDNPYIRIEYKSTFSFPPDEECSIFLWAYKNELPSYFFNSLSNYDVDKLESEWS